jgi:hypothetical protein
MPPPTKDSERLEKLRDIVTLCREARDVAEELELPCWADLSNVINEVGDLVEAEL